MQILGSDKGQPFFGKRPGSFIEGIELIQEVELKGIPITGLDDLAFIPEVIKDV